MNILKKIKKVLDDTEIFHGANNQTIDFDKEINSVDSELFKIFLMVSEEKEISVYKARLLDEKLTLLEMKIIEIMNTILVKYNNKAEALDKLSRFLKIMFVVGGLLLFASQLYGFAFIYITALINYRTAIEKLRHERKAKTVKPYLEKGDNMEVTIDNCRMFLKTHLNETIEHKAGELEDKELRMITLANQKIELFVLGSKSEEISEEMSQIMVKILQDDLGTDETDLAVLLETATKRIEEEKTEKKEDNLRIRIKKSKKDEK